MNIDYDRMKKYFEQKMPLWPLVSGFVAVALGILMVVILSNTRGMPLRGLMTPLGLLFILVGAVTLIIYFAKKIKDSELDVYLPEIEKKFLEDFKNSFTETDPAKIRYNMTYGDHKHEDKFEPLCFGTFCFDRPEILHKTGDDSKVRSSVYSVSAFALRHEYIDLGEREVSLISADNPIEGNFIKVKYVDLASAELVHTEKIGYQGRTKYRHLRLTDNDGKVVMEFPILADASADDYVEDINLRIKRHKETAEQQ